MTIPKPSISINVDVTNPGHFFACCGLLELADRLWPGAEGWFEGRRFCVACEGTIAELITRLTEAHITSTLSDSELKRLGTLLSKKKSELTSAEKEEKQYLNQKWKCERLFLSAPFKLWIDWWRDEMGGRTELKTWAAKQLVAEMARGMLQLIKPPNDFVQEPFRSVPADALPFYFDSDLGRCGRALDAGFSYDAVGLKPQFRPLVELLAFVAFQRFRPAKSRHNNLLLYSTWSTPLIPPVAAPVASRPIGLPNTRLYQFGLFDRTKYMKAFLPSQPYEGD